MPSKRSANLQTQVQDLLTKAGIHSLPVPVDKIAKCLGAEVRFSPLDDELSGMIYINEGTPIIGVNSLHHPNRQRFTIAHEIGHLVLHHDRISGKVHVDKQFPVQLAVRHREAAERTVLTAIATGAPPALLAELLIATETDRVFADGGHSLDFINKSLENRGRTGAAHRSAEAAWIDQIETWLDRRRGTGIGRDDPLDACACALAARDSVQRIPSGDPPLARGLRMEMWY